MGSITENKTKVLLVGTGGVGTMAAYALESGGLASVTAICRSNYAAVMKSGFTIDSIEHGSDITGFRPTEILDKVPDVTMEDHEAFEYVLVTTKNIPDISPTVLDIIEPAITPDVTTIVLLQNGLNIEKPIISAFPNNAVLSGVSLIGATEVSKGVIRHDDSDRVKLGAFPGQSLPAEFLLQKAHRFIELYTACGKVHWDYDDNVELTRWRKLVYNASFNSVSAILGMDTARMRMSQHVIDDLIRPAMLEVIAVARTAGFELPAGLDDDMIRVDPTDTGFVPSMGQDAAKGNYIEMENIVGEPVREAKRLGVDAPTLRTIYGLLRGLQLKTKEARGLWKPVFEEENPYA